MRYFDEPVGRVKIQTTSKNIQRYYTLKCLIRDLLSNNFFFPKFWLAKVLNFTRPGVMRRVQISCDVCTRFARYLYSRKQSWIIMEFIIQLCFLEYKYRAKRVQITDICTRLIPPGLVKFKTLASQNFGKRNRWIINLLLDVLVCSIAVYIFTRCLYFDSPYGLVKILHNS